MSREGMFGVTGSGDTSGFGGLARRGSAVPGTPRPYGGDFDEVVNALAAALAEAYPGVDDAIERVVVDRGELTLHIAPARIAEVCQALRDNPALRYELCSSVSGVDYLDATATTTAAATATATDATATATADAAAAGRRLHVVYELTSMTFRRRLRLECAVTTADPRVPTVTSVYPTADWQEREAYDMFGIVFTGHPGLTRILMPDDWEGHPQRKDYPLGGVPVEYKGAEIPPPDSRRSYQ